MKNTAKFKRGYDKHGKWRMFDKMIRTTTKKKPIVTEKGLVLWGKAKEEKQFENNYRKRQINIQNYKILIIKRGKRMSLEVSKSDAVVIGRILETNVKYDPELKNRFDNSIKGAYTTAEFKNPMFKVAMEREIDGKKVTATVKVAMDDIFKIWKSKDGRTGDISTFGEIEKILNSQNGGKGLLVKFSGSFNENKRATKDLTIFRENEFKAQYIALSNLDENKQKAEGRITGIIGGLSEETVNDSKTGRLIVNLYKINYVNKDGVPYVDMMNLIVPSEIAEAFLNLDLEIGDSVWLDVEIKNVQHGNVKKNENSRGGFGNREAETTSGYVATEFHIFNGDRLPSSDKNYIDSDELETLKHSYQITCENMIQKKKEKLEGNTSSSNNSASTSISGRTFEADANDPFSNENGFLNTDDVNPFMPFA